MEKRKRIILKIALSITALLLLCTFLSQTIYTMLLPVVETVVVAPGVVDFWANCSGVVDYSNKADIVAPGEWVVKDIYARSGEPVEQGQALFAIDTTQAEIDIKQQQLAVLKIKNQLKADGLNPDIKEELRLSLAIAEDTLALLRSQTPSGGILTAEKSGTVIDVIEDGTISVHAGEKLASILSADSVPQVKWTLPSAEGDRFLAGDDVAVTLPAMVTEKNGNRQKSDTTLHLKIKERSFHAVTNEWTFSVSLDDENKDTLMGNSAQIRVHKSGETCPKVIPVSCLVRDGSGYKVRVLQTKPGVFGEKTIIKETKVEVAQQNNILAEIDGGELPAGAEVVQYSTKPLINGDVVSVGRQP